MSLQKKDLIAPLLQNADWPKAYPWYPTAYLAHVQKGNYLQRLAAFVNHPLRVHGLVSDEPATEDIPEATAPLVVTEQPAITPNEVQAVDPTVPQETATEEIEKPVLLPKPEPVESSGDDDSFLFQPFFTVDYFASQGIKTEMGNIPVTRFDQQLKSFTQWLKTMKRADYQTGQFTADPTVDAHAKASLEAKEVVTEAMAEVLAQQGRLAQAIAMYRKLTLLHPEKSTFFAAQIEKLKA